MAHAQQGSHLTLHYRLAGHDGVDIVNTFGGKPATLSLGTGRTTVLQGVVHLVIFAAYLFTTVVP